MPVIVRTRLAPDAACDVELVADGCAEILGEFGADDDVVAGDARFARDDVVREPDDLEVDCRVDAGDRDRAAGFAAHGERRARHGRRYDRHLRHGQHLIADLRPLVDRQHALRRALDRRCLHLLGTASAGVARPRRVRRSWIWGCDVSTRLMKLACSPASIADMKTMTATPIAMPLMMNIVCMRPSLRKRMAAIHSNGIQRFMASPA